VMRIKLVVLLHHIYGLFMARTTVLDSQWLEGLKLECRGHADHRLHFKTIRFV